MSRRRWWARIRIRNVCVRAWMCLVIHPKGHFVLCSAANGSSPDHVMDTMYTGSGAGLTVDNKDAQAFNSCNVHTTFKTLIWKR